MGQRYRAGRSRQLSAIRRQWDDRRRCYDHRGLVVRMEYEASEVLHLGLSPAVDGRPAIVWAWGEVDLATSPWLLTVLDAQLSNGTDVVVDLADVTFIDASAVGALVGARRAGQQAGATLTLRRPSRRVEKVLDLTGLSALVSPWPPSEAAWDHQIVSLAPP